MLPSVPHPVAVTSLERSAISFLASQARLKRKQERTVQEGRAFIKRAYRFYLDDVLDAATFLRIVQVTVRRKKKADRSSLVAYSGKGAVCRP